MPQDDKPLSEDDLEQVRRGLARLSHPTVRDKYKELHRACAMTGEKLPAPSVVQQFIQVYRQLWKWRRNK